AGGRHRPAADFLAVAAVLDDQVELLLDDDDVAAGQHVEAAEEVVGRADEEALHFLTADRAQPGQHALARDGDDLAGAELAGAKEIAAGLLVAEHLLLVLVVLEQEVLQDDEGVARGQALNAERLAGHGAFPEEVAFEVALAD